MKCVSRNLSCISIALLAFVVGTAAVSAFGQEDTKLKTKADYKFKDRGFCTNNNWSGNDSVSGSELREMTVASNGSLNVDGGRNGGISVKGEDRNDVLIRACIQTSGKTEEDAKSVAANIRINTGGTIKAEGPTEENHWSVSYEIHVPRSTNVELSAHNGGISINGVDGAAEFATENGGVALSNVSGNFKGHTTNGGVFVRLEGSGWKGTGLDVTTTNGGVNIEMPENYAAHVETGTVNGGFNSDIRGLSMEKTTDENGRRQRPTKISTDINGGGPPIRVSTINGGVRIGTVGDKD